MIRKVIALDWHAMKKYQIRILLVLPMAVLISLLSPILVIPMCVFAFVNYSINPFAVEEKGALNHLYLTLPVKRRDILTGRYILSLIMLFCGTVVGVAVMPIGNAILASKWFIGVDGYLVITAVSFLLFSLLNLSMFPMLFRFGYQKGKYWGYYTPLGIFLVIILVFSTISMTPGMIKFISFASENMLLISGGMFALGIMLLALSYAISLKVYSKRDL